MQHEFKERKNLPVMKCFLLHLSSSHPYPFISWRLCVSTWMTCGRRIRAVWCSSPGSSSSRRRLWTSWVCSLLWKSPTVAANILSWSAAEPTEPPSEPKMQGRRRRSRQSWTPVPSWRPSRTLTCYVSSWTSMKLSGRRFLTVRSSAVGSASLRSWAPAACSLKSVSTFTAGPASPSTSRSRSETAKSSALRAPSRSVPL